MRSLIISTLVLGVGLAFPTDVEKDPHVNKEGAVQKWALLENLILGLLEDVRGIMVAGSEGVPVLDPLQVPGVYLDGSNIGFPGSHIDLDDVTVNDLSTFNVDLKVETISLLLQRYRFIFDASIPELYAEAKSYDLSVNALGYTAFGKGAVSVSIVEPRLSGSCRLSVQISTSGMTFVISETDLKLSLVDFKLKTTGMFGNDAVSTFVDTFVRYLVPDLVQSYEAEISEFLNEIVTEAGNAILGDLNLSDILG